MADIKVAGSLIPTGVNTPLDKRSRVATLAETANIGNPVLGAIFYCEEDHKHYKITSLKSKTIGPAVVENAAVKSYEEFGGNPEEIAAINTSLASLDTRVSALEISGGGTTVTVQNFTSVTSNKTSFTGNIPVGVMTNSGNYYPVEKGSLTISGGVATLDVTPYLAYDNAASFSGTWTAYFATGTAPASVLDWIAPDHARATDIPAWDTIYQATTACWISVSFLGGTTGGVMIGPSTTDLNGTPFGMWVGASGITGEYMTVFCPKGWYYQAHLENADASLSYSHKKVYICKGA